MNLTIRSVENRIGVRLTELRRSYNKALIGGGKKKKQSWYDHPGGITSRYNEARSDEKARKQLIADMRKKPLSIGVFQKMLHHVPKLKTHFSFMKMAVEARGRFIFYFTEPWRADKSSPHIPDEDESHFMIPYREEIPKRSRKHALRFRWKSDDLRKKKLRPDQIKELYELSFQFYYGPNAPRIKEIGRKYPMRKGKPIFETLDAYNNDGKPLYTLITSSAVPEAREVNFFCEVPEYCIHATTHNWEHNQCERIHIHALDFVEPLRILNAPNHWRHEIFSFPRGHHVAYENMLRLYCEHLGYDGWRVRSQSDNVRLSQNVLKARFEVVVLRSSFSKLRRKKKLLMKCCESGCSIPSAHYIDSASDDKKQYLLQFNETF